MGPLWLKSQRFAAAADNGANFAAATVLSCEGTNVSVLRKGASDWDPAHPPDQTLRVGDHLRTLENSRATLRLGTNSIMHVDQRSLVEILPPRNVTAKSHLQLLRGLLYLLHRDDPSQLEVDTPSANATIEGTDFALAVDEEGVTRLALIDGQVELSNSEGSIRLNSGEMGIAEPGLKPRKTSVIESINLLQWNLYYPGVLDPDELKLDFPVGGPHEASLAAYRTGDLLQAMDLYSKQTEGAEGAELLYHAALLLAGGQVADSQYLLVKSESTNSMTLALRYVIAAAQNQRLNTLVSNASPSLLLGLSYYEQSQSRLKEALKAAKEAVRLSPAFGFGWERVAELEFGFGRVSEAQQALDRALRLAPRNAQAVALKGFLLAAQNRTAEATNWFDRAIALDGTLGNAWLGRGLCRIRLGRSAEGRADLLMAAAMEPKRAVLRSYLGKAFADAGNDTHAARELRLAREIDPKDPTSWLYSALLKREQNQINGAVDDLEKSIALNDNRAVYRSRLLLDEDRGVRSSSLAEVYQAAGMTDLSAREAARAVSYDYGNYSAHQFLSESFDALRDPTRFNLRYETVWFNELLLADLLAPVGGTPLSQNISQEEYSRLFERNRIGLLSSSAYRSDGQYRELASQYGTVGNTGWSLDLDYQHNNGVRPNNQLDRIEWYTTLKQQLTPQDSVMLLTKYYDYGSGDNFQYYNPAGMVTNPPAFHLPVVSIVRTNYVFDETEKPLFVVGYHHEWQPGIHTLILAGRLEDEQRVSDKNDQTLILATPAGGGITSANPSIFDINYRDRFTIYAGELNQIFQSEQQTLVLGARYQNGTFSTTDQIAPSATVSFLKPFFPNTNGSANDFFQRASGYGYYTLKAMDHLLLTIGLTHDHITFPTDFRSPPVAQGSITRDQTSPKAAVVWSPLPELTVRGMASRALGGVSFDESFRLEPGELAGFNQAFRSVISESIAGSVAAPTYDIAGAALDVKLGSRTYLGLEGGLIKSEVRQDIGVFNFSGTTATPSITSQTLNYHEYSLIATMNQLIDDEWSAGARYQFTRSTLDASFPELSGIPPANLATLDTANAAELHRAVFFAQFNHRSGLFARAETQWYHQNNTQYPASDFYQANAVLGWRFPRQRGEISVALLNLNNSDYQLNPLTPYEELPRKRVLLARFALRF